MSDQAFGHSKRVRFQVQEQVILVQQRQLFFLGQLACFVFHPFRKGLKFLLFDQRALDIVNHIFFLLPIMSTSKMNPSFVTSIFIFCAPLPLSIPDNLPLCVLWCLVADDYRRLLDMDRFFLELESTLVAVFYQVFQSKQTILLLFMEGLQQNRKLDGQLFAKIQWSIVEQLITSSQQTILKLIRMTQPKPQTNKLHNEHDSDFQSCDSEESVSITQQIEDAIRDLPSLNQKVQAIAINYYLLQKREIDEKKQHDIARLQFNTRNTFNTEIQEMNSIVEGTAPLTKEDFDFILENKALLKQGELESVQKIMNGEEKLAEGQINQYWLKCLETSEIIAEQIQESDKQVLKFLYRIEGYKNEDNTKLTISFLFKPNKWFHNEKISKTFEINKNNEAQKSIGDQIEWKQGMNYTVTVKSKKNKKNKKVKEEIIPEPSFFHFFKSISSKEQDNEQIIKDEERWDDLMEDLEIQYELSEHVYEDLIPKSLQFYLNCQPEEVFPVVGDKINVTADQAVKDDQEDEGAEEE